LQGVFFVRSDHHQVCFSTAAHTFVIPVALPTMPKHLTRRAALCRSCDITPYMITETNVLINLITS